MAGSRGTSGKQSWEDYQIWTQTSMPQICR